MVTVSAFGSVTVTVAVANLFESTVEVAVTVSEEAVSSVATVKVPSVEIVVLEFPPLTVQLTVCSGSFMPVTWAVKTCVSPFTTVAVSGLTVTAVTVGVAPTIMSKVMSISGFAEDFTVTSTGLVVTAFAVILPDSTEI